MNVKAFIVSPKDCKPGDLIWACEYRKNPKTKKVSDMLPTHGMLTLTNTFEEEAKNTGLPPQGLDFILAACSCYHTKYQTQQPRYFVPILHGNLLWQHATALSTVLLAHNKQDCEDIYQYTYETTICEEEDETYEDEEAYEDEEDEEENPYLLISELHMEHPNAKHLRIGQFLFAFQEWHQREYHNDIFYVENKELVTRIQKYVQTL